MNSSPFTPPRARRAAPNARIKGTVLVISLVILAVMLISAAALVRSFDTALGTAGNVAFKRDLAQQSERVSQNILTLFRGTGHFSVRANRSTSDVSRNYSAVVLPSNPQGIPVALLTNGAMDPAVGTAGDIAAGRGIDLRYVIDRMCSLPGDDRVLGADACTIAGGTRVPGGDVVQWQNDAARGSSSATGAAGSGLAGAAPQPIVYRLSIRATGPRNTQAFFQTTFSCCDG
ncbi:MAG TPA: hypothetical protein VFR90_17615 [Methylibium sp.]|uniref:hypothetical protein n=1 Tax=Methylibium sp. TaxID=2067992 RepID=UPI002DBC2D8D|nr:hypothetical protein [Methylibium sp.]HEU4460943.1 hypothetical protein [Methylibium sp.]